MRKIIEKIHLTVASHFSCYSCVSFWQTVDNWNSIFSFEVGLYYMILLYMDLCWTGYGKEPLNLLVFCNSMKLTIYAFFIGFYWFSLISSTKSSEECLISSKFIVWHWLHSPNWEIASGFSASCSGSVCIGAWNKGKSNCQKSEIHFI